MLKKLHGLIARALGTDFQGEAGTSALIALKLMKQHGLLDNLFALGEALKKPKPKKKKRYKSTHFASVGGRHGAAARAAALTPEERVAIARKAAQARWANKHQKLPKGKSKP